MTPPSVADDPGMLGEYAASDGRTLAYREWLPADRPSAYVIGLHGIQSHSGWYGYSSNAMSDVGIAVRMLDRRGSGLNSQARRHATTAARLVDDVAEAARIYETERAAANASAPLILLGLSWGARLAAAVCHAYPEMFDRLILLYPGICTRVRPNIVQRLLLRWMNRLGAGTVPIRLPLRPEQFTSDDRRQNFIRHDPAALRKVTASFLLVSEELSQQAIAGLQQLGIPQLVMLAGQDEIVDVPQTYELLSHVPSESLTVTEYPDARHTLEFEPDRDRFVADMTDWIKSIDPCSD